MASNNFLTVKTHLSEFKNSSDKDTVSEVSIVRIIYIPVVLFITHVRQLLYIVIIIKNT